ncbi:MAG: hypothetical protein WA854_13390, partial [Candidatus Binataceae bacterium]
PAAIAHSRFFQNYKAEQFSLMLLDALCRMPIRDAANRWWRLARGAKGAFILFSEEKTKL